MRSARADDHWRRVYDHSYQSSILDLEYQAVQGLGSGNLAFGGGITAICGGNGVGKTTVLLALLGILKPSEILSSRSRSLRLSGNHLSANILDRGQQILRTFNLMTGEVDPVNTLAEVQWVDFAYQCPKMMTYFGQTTNLDEFLETVEPQQSDSAELEVASYLVGKEYTSRSTYELEDVDPEQNPLPYFRVSDGGAEYGTETMGLGELSIHYMMWLLKRAARDSIMLIEEPETYLAPRSQQALLNILAEYSARMGIWVVLTTHSPTLLNRIPVGHVKFLARVNNLLKVTSPTAHSDYFPALGMPILRKGVLLVEDRASRQFATEWIGHHNPRLLQEFEIKDASGVDPIRKALQIFPKLDGWFKIVGLFDGDQRGKLNDELAWPYTFLPGDLDPETQLRQAASQEPTRLSAELGRSEDRVYTALGTLQGQDHHDWFEELARYTAVSYNELMRALFRTWVSDPVNAQRSREAMNALEALIDSDGR